jgi:hypothetical protein
MLGCSTD